MALAVFTQSCAKNTSGASKVFIAERANVTGITVTTGEISEVTGTTPFKRIDTIQDSVYWNQTGERVGLNNWKETNEIGFSVMPPATTTNTLIQSLIDGSPCGLLAIVIDGNGKVWLVGYNSIDTFSRLLKLSATNQATGKGLSEEEGNTIPVVLGNECSGRSLPLDSTLSAEVIAGTSAIIQWTA